MTGQEGRKMEPPKFPAGDFVPGPDPLGRKEELISAIEAAPGALRSALHGLSATQLDTRYRNWTLRQIAHHLADSHLNSFLRFRLALTETNPTIKPYDETLWSELIDSRTAPIASSLSILEGIHQRWGLMLRAMKDEDFSRTFFHPEAKKERTLALSLELYAWHGRHHTGQILWRRGQEGWD
jgi:hypothetical protein